MTDRPTRPRRVAPTRQDPEALTFAREAKGWSQVDLAAAVGMSRSLLCEMEKGTRGATPARLKQIADVLNCPVSVLERKRQAVA
jgi:transcriptional regulator with XRE-family HTH domain